MDYQNGKIYRIDCFTTGKVYIGSTCQPTLAKRLSQHVCKFNQWKNGKQHFISSFEVLEGKYQITLVEAYPCNSKDELNSREGHFIRTMDCINKRIKGRTKQEYYEANKELILVYKKAPFICECGKRFQLCRKQQHRRTKFHIQNTPFV